MSEFLMKWIFVLHYDAERRFMTIITNPWVDVKEIRKVDEVKAVNICLARMET